MEQAAASALKTFRHCHLIPPSAATVQCRFLISFHVIYLALVKGAWLILEFDAPRLEVPKILIQFAKDRDAFRFLFGYGVFKNCDAATDFHFLCHIQLLD